MTIVEVLAVLLLILLAGFFAMAEFSIVSSRHNRLEHLGAKGSSGARIAIQLAEKPVRIRSAVQVGTTLCTMLVGTLSGAILAARLEAWLREWPPMVAYGSMAAIVILVAATTYLSLIVGELVPKQLALRNPEAIASRVAPVLAVLARMTAPIIWLLDESTNFVLRRMGMRAGIERTVTEEDIHSIVSEGAKLGVIHHAERDMIEGVLDLEDTPVRSIMTPRPQVAWIDINEPRESILSKIGSCPYAQMVVGRDSIDEW
jgi:putative hemolysin